MSTAYLPLGERAFGGEQDLDWVESDIFGRSFGLEFWGLKICSNSCFSAEFFEWLSLLKNFCACDLVWELDRVPTRSLTWFQLLPNFRNASRNRSFSSSVHRPSLYTSSSTSDVLGLTFCSCSFNRFELPFFSEGCGEHSFLAFKGFFC